MVELLNRCTYYEMFYIDLNVQAFPSCMLLLIGVWFFYTRQLVIVLFFFLFQDEYNLNPGLEWEDEFTGKGSLPRLR